ncbi:hypothetical protein FA95DRAFT_1554524 [Auriscalpium vulgare]|uniref:Uncharacterized protein n=1 Tax=Auriscalpium vulgare TaxID=40419 RepID=A0ACB8S502_9AGAM|nr:hypothetical protein FA95DRAFT_1554524 [Auriscalpium vulgare]
MSLQHDGARASDVLDLGPSTLPTPKDATLVLPNEVLMHIFYFLFRPHPVARVCRRWREIALACTMDINLDRDPQRGADFWQERMSRAKAASLFITYMSPHRKSLTAVEKDLIVEHLPRIRWLELSLSHGDEDLLPNLTQRAPLLERLLIESLNDEWPAGLFGDHAPRLQELGLRSIFSVPWASPIFRGLVSLTIESSDDGRKPEQCDAFLDALAGMQFLEHLFLEEAFRMSHPTNSHDTHARVVLPRLAVLAVTGVSPTHCMHTLTHLSIPPTAQFRLSASALTWAPTRPPFAPLVPALSHHLANWAQAAARPTLVSFKSVSGELYCVVNRAAHASDDQDDLALDFTCKPAFGDMPDIARLAWDAISWDAVEQLVLADFSRDMAWLDAPWWGILKTMRCVRTICARGATVEALLQFLTAEDVCLAQGRRDTFLPALEDLTFEAEDQAAAWGSLAPEMKDAFRAWVDDRRELGRPLKRLCVKDCPQGPRVTSDGRFELV